MIKNEEFETKCMDVMEKIIHLKTTTSREKALAIAEELMISASGKNPDPETLRIFKKVIEEFSGVTDEEFKIFAKSILEG